MVRTRFPAALTICTLAVALAATGCVAIGGKSATATTLAETRPATTNHANGTTLPTTEQAATPLDGPATTAQASTVSEDGMITIEGDGEPRELTTTCFNAPDFVLPKGWKFLDASSDVYCSFGLQGSRADEASMVGELFSNAAQKNIDEVTAQLEASLAEGAELDMPMLGLMNSGPTGEPLTVHSVDDLQAAQPTVIITHDTNRRAGRIAHTAIVQAPTSPDGTTNYILIWDLPGEGQLDMLNELLARMTVTLPTAWNTPATGG